MEEMRLNKYLAHCGVCSRRNADQLIAEGVITINGRVGVLSDRVSEGDCICVNGKQICQEKSYRVYAFYKPVGVTCTEKDKHAKKIVKDYLQLPGRVTYAGRLDKDSEGLLIMTNDGDLIQAMMRGTNGHEKEYIVKVNKEITADFVNQMSNGVYLKELGQTTRKCVVEKIGKYTIRIILTQGLNRQIRRMCDCFGYKVERLMRVRIMNVMLGKMTPGQYRELDAQECNELYKACGL